MPDSRLVHIVAMASAERAELARACYALEYHAEIYASYDELIGVAPDRGLVIAQDIESNGGITELVAGMDRQKFWLPVVAAGHHPEPGRVVAAIKAGALDYLPLPLDQVRLRDTLLLAGREAENRLYAHRQAAEARARLARLTHREREVLNLLVAGSSNKIIARDLQISPRTVEIHRAHMMQKLGATHAADAVRMWLEASMGASPVSPAPSLAA